LIDRAEWLGVPAVVLGELWIGFLARSRREANEFELAEFLRNPIVSVLPVDADVARVFADVVSDLRRAGRPLPTNDIWIAATAARAGATILTYDSHFESITRVGSHVIPSAAP
jgi:predicted nucleic acid-binding protein